MENKKNLTFIFIFGSAFFLFFCLTANPAQAEVYQYSSANKVDPFSPLPLLRPSIKGVTRLQEYELSELELIGTILSSEVSALILTPEPREGILSKVGDRIGKRSGTIVAISRNKIVVREPSLSNLPGARNKFSDTVLTLSQPKKKDGEKDKSALNGSDNAVPKSPSGLPGGPQFPGNPQFNGSGSQSLPGASSPTPFPTPFPTPLSAPPPSMPSYSPSSSSLAVPEGGSEPLPARYKPIGGITSSSSRTSGDSR